MFEISKKFHWNRLKKGLLFNKVYDLAFLENLIFKFLSRFHRKYSSKKYQDFVDGKTKFSNANTNYNELSLNNDAEFFSR